MQPKEMIALLQKEPFEAIRLFLNDGRTFEIRHPEKNIVTQEIFYLGIPDRKAPDQRLDKFQHLAWGEIVRVEPLSTSASRK